jgi:hypothetical protein
MRERERERERERVPWKEGELQKRNEGGHHETGRHNQRKTMRMLGGSRSWETSGSRALRNEVVSVLGFAFATDSFSETQDRIDREDRSRIGLVLFEKSVISSGF